MNQTTTRIFSILIASTVLGIAGCSGGSSADTEPADPGQTAGGGTNAAPEDPTPVPPAPSANKITLSGLVTDSPVPNAVVRMNVDGRSFEATTPTDLEGAYQVGIESADPDALVLCEAFDPFGTVRFTALLDTFAGLQARASSDGVVAGMNITNVTTAQYALASRYASDGSVDGWDELRAVAEVVDTEELLRIAAAVKLVVENIDGIVLPAEYADTQELADALAAGTSTFIADVEITNPGALDTAIAAVIADGNATIPFGAARTSGVYVDSATGDIVALFADGSGLASFTGSGLRAIPSWSIDALGRLQVRFATELDEAAELTLLSDSADVANAVIQTTDVAGTASGDMTYATLARFAFEGGFSAGDFAGSYYDAASAGELIVFSADNTGHSRDLADDSTSDPFNWSVDPDGSVVMNSLVDRSRTRIHRLRPTGESTHNALWVASDRYGEVTDMGFVRLDRLD